MLSLRPNTSPVGPASEATAERCLRASGSEDDALEGPGKLAVLQEARVKRVLGREIRARLQAAGRSDGDRAGNER